MKLMIAIPAYNEENSIERIIERSLAAINYIIAFSPVKEVEITVVSDGSTDRTAELAKRYVDQIKLIVFEVNRGYGAAIKEAWHQSNADILGFLDADGTCDPNFFAQLCKTLTKEQADIVLGCRLNPKSRMPLVRRIGNKIFAWTLSFLASTKVCDTASGMRVVRRSSLEKLMPLPDGLHFTPAMSARAALSGDVKIIEVEMPYHEREGESKLRIGKDSIRFLKVILGSAFLYRPSRPLGLLAILCFFVAFVLMIAPTVYYVKNRLVVEWMIYRFIVSQLMGTCGALLLSACYLTKKIVRLTVAPKINQPRKYGFLWMFFSSSLFMFVPLLMMLIGGALVFPSFLELVKTGATYEHWSRFIAMASLFSISFILIVTRVIDLILGLISEHLKYLKDKKSL